MKTTPIRRLAALAVLVATAPALAQNAGGEGAEAFEEPGTVTPMGSDTEAPSFTEQAQASWSFSFGADHLIRRSLTGGGDVELTDLRGRIGYRKPLNRQWQLGFGVGFGLTDYEFPGTPRIGANAWREVYNLQVSAALQYQATNEWTVFGGPIIETAWERGADIDKGLTGGAIIGASYQFDDGLRLGAGFGVKSELEDDLRVFPLIIIDWNISNDLRLTARNRVESFAGGGLELVLDYSREFEFGFGFRYDRRRFRLDSEGVAPDGVGEFTHYPVYLTGTWRLSPQATVTLRCSASFDGRFDLEDEDGGGVGESTYDIGFAVGGSFSFRF